MMFPFLLMILGLCYGSFLNVLIYRIPKNISIIYPKSFCTDCKEPIPLFRNIPIISFLIQKGRCHNCKNRISFQYPVIEAITGFLWFYFTFITIFTFMILRAGETRGLYFETLQNRKC